MNSDYVITNEELDQEYGLDLDDYALESTLIPAIIKIGLELSITAILSFNDNFSYESDIETALDDDEDLVSPFKKLQYRVIYNLIFLGDNDPIDYMCEKIITYDLKWGKINGFQKGLFRK